MNYLTVKLKFYTDNARLQSLIYKTSTFLMGCLQIKRSAIHQRV